MFIGCAGPFLNIQNASVSMLDIPIRKVAVMNFEFARSEYEAISFGNVRRPKNAGSVMADIFTEKLLGTGLYQLIERRQIQKILDEFGLSITGLLDSKSPAEVGEILKVDGLVIGTVSEYCDYQAGLNWGGDVDFSARLIDVHSGSVVWSVSARRNFGASNSGFTAHAAVSVAIQELLKKMNDTKSHGP